MKYVDKIVLIFKVILFVFVILSPVISYKAVATLNNIYFKISMLAFVVALCFIDFQLGIIAMIAFMILVINLNQKVFDGFEVQAAEPLNFACEQPVQNNISNDLFNLFIDDKIKPYEVYVKMMTNETALDKAQGL